MRVRKGDTLLYIPFPKLSLKKIKFYAYISVEIKFYKIKLTGLVISLASHNNYNTTMQAWSAISIFFLHFKNVAMLG